MHLSTKNKTRKQQLEVSSFRRHHSQCMPILKYLITESILLTVCFTLMVCYCSDGEAGNSRGPKAEKFTLQELQGKTNKALMVRLVL